LRKDTARKWLGIGLALPALLLVALIVALPIAQSFIVSFQNGPQGGWTFENYRKLFSDPNSVANIVYTLQIVAATVLLTTVAAYLLALYLNTSRSWCARTIEKLYIIPQFIPGIVAVYAMMGLIRDTGALNRLLLSFGIAFKPGLMYTPEGIVLMNLWFNIPFATMIIGAELAGIPVSIVESARDVGAGRFQIFRSMILPLSLKSALVAATFVFIGNVGSFTTPFLMGTNAPRMLGVALYQEFGVFHNLPQAAALSVFMFALCAIVGAFYIRSMTRKEPWRANES
jgi:ABC-type spermidine/putrescine transport system permease subunit I